ncbi:thioredoxin, mitochondrial [Narcine bancroftii]|uniref:thioredoxin, mitochondrial n=1 Tax=Narcine bancroftii TaxID=1343680 RepID=UPI00383215BE
MAHRLLARRLVSATLWECPLRSRSSAHLLALNSLCWRGTKPPFHHRASITTTRAFCAGHDSGVSFNIQDQADFTDRVINSTKPILVDFYASWCRPCGIIGPRLEKMVVKQEGKVLMAKVDIDDHTDLASEYQVTMVPTVIAIKEGNIVSKFEGVKSEEELEVFIKKLI